MNNCVIYCTVPNEFNANLIATTLIEENIAACVNILPSVTSVYKWEGIVQTDNEMLLIIVDYKSYGKTEEAVELAHPLRVAAGESTCSQK